MSTSFPQRCQCRRHAETNLRCSRCNVLICPDCSKIAPVGMLCRDCARGRRSPLYEVSLSSLGLAFVVCLIVAIVGGWLVSAIGSFGFFGWIAAFFFGVGIGELALRVAKRKRGRSMEILAGSCALLGIVIGQLFIHLPQLLAHNTQGVNGEFGIDSPQSAQLAYLFNPWNYLSLLASVGLAVFGAVNRIRNI